MTGFEQQSHSENREKKGVLQPRLAFVLKFFSITIFLLTAYQVEDYNDDNTKHRRMQMKNKLPIIILSIALLISVGGNVYLIAMKNQLAEVQNQLAIANNQIASLQGELSEYQTKTANLQDEIAHGNEQIETLESALNEGSLQIENMKTELSEKNTVIADLEESLAQKQQVTATSTNTSGTGTSGTTSQESNYQPPQRTEAEKAEMEADGFGTSNGSLQDLLRNAQVSKDDTMNPTGSDIGVGVKLK